MSARDFTLRAIILIGLLGLAMLMMQLARVFLLVFAGIVVAAVLLSLVRILRRFVPVRHGVALAIVLVLLVLSFILMVVMFGGQVNRELGTLITMLPKAWENAQGWLKDVPMGNLVQEQFESLGSDLSRIATTAGSLAVSFTGGLIEVFLVMVGGIYFAAQPNFYRDGLLKLFPKGSRAAIGDGIDASGNSLRLWLGGQIIVMAAVGTMIGVSLYFLGVPAAFALGLITFLMEFVPIIGPILAAIPAVLLGLTVSPTIGLATLGVFVVLQQIEGNVLQPLVQQKAVHLPPALLLFSLFAFGAIFGLLGMILAAPLTVFLYVLIKKLYVRDLLDTPTEVPGEKQP